jgi:hypothetical protein
MHSHQVHHTQSRGPHLSGQSKDRSKPEKDIGCLETIFTRRSPMPDAEHLHEERNAWSHLPGVDRDGPWLLSDMEAAAAEA